MGSRVYHVLATVDHGERIPFENTLAFVEDPDFLDEFNRLGFTDDDLLSVQLYIMALPERGKIVPVSQSIRDMFYSPPSRPDLSGFVRYVHLSSANTVLLLTAYSGREILPMTAAECAEAESYIERQTTYFSKRFTR